jgi:hypothetical protein
VSPAQRSSSALVALALAACATSACSSAPPLPGGPPPVFEPGRPLALPGENGATPSDAPATPPDATPAGGAPSPATAPPPGSSPPSSSAAPAGPGPGSWTSTSVEAPPAPAGAGDPVPADGRLGAKHLLVMYVDSRRAPEGITRTRDQARQRAEECLAKAEAPGADWGKVVTECTDEPHGASRAGDLGTFPPHAMVAEFTKGVLDTKVGQLSRVVESPFGFHVILRTK